MLRLASRHQADRFFERKQRSLSKLISLGHEQPMPVEEFLARPFVLDPALAFRYDDMYALLAVETSDAAMEVISSGPTYSGLALRRGVNRLKLGDGVFADKVVGSYGLHLRMTRDGARLRLQRVLPHSSSPPGENLDQSTATNDGNSGGHVPPLEGPDEVDVQWDEFEAAVQEYWIWVLTEHREEAPWLKQVPQFAEWRTEVGLDGE